MRAQRCLTSIVVALLWVVMVLQPARANDAIVQRIEALQAGFPVKVLEQPLMARRALASFYSARAYNAAWTHPDTRQALITAVERAADEGLNPDDYHASALVQLHARAEAEASEELQADLDVLFSDAFLMLGSHLLEGKVNPQTIHAEWTADRRKREMAPILAEALSHGDIAGALETLRPSHPAYRSLMDARRFLADLRGQPWPTLSSGPAIRPGDRSDRLPGVRERLQALAFLPDNAADAGEPADATWYDAELEGVITLFQARHGLEPDGIIGRGTLAALNLIPLERIHKIDASLERWRWLPESLGDTHVRVNIAGYELVLVENGVEALRSRVIVGRPFRQTPVFSDRIRYLVFNPTWTVPRKLMIEDQLPAIIGDPDYLQRLNMSVYSGWGTDRERIDPSTIDWATLSRNNFPYQLVQEPGPQNALGQVKFMFPNQYDVYLHDTPGRGLFARAERSFSSGCIRVEAAFDLAERLLAGVPGWSRNRIEGVVNASQPVTVMLPTPVPVHIQYWTAWVDEQGKLQFRNDVYQRDARLLAELRKTIQGEHVLTPQGG